MYAMRLDEHPINTLLNGAHLPVGMLGGIPIIPVSVCVVLLAIAVVFLVLWLRNKKDSEVDLDIELQTRKKFEKMFFQSESHFTSLLRGLKVGIALICGDDMTIQMANQALCDIYKVAPEDILGKKCSAVLEHGGDENCENCPGLMAIASGLPAESTLSFIRNDGKRMVARIYASPISDVDGNMTDFLLIVEDITSRKEMEESLHLSEKRYLMLFNELNEGFIFTGIIQENDQPVGLKILDINPSFARIASIDDETDILDMDLGDMFPEDRRKQIIDGLLQTVISGEPQRFECYIPPKDQYLEFSSFCPVEGYIAILCEEITGQKRAEMQLAEIRDKEVEFGSHIQQTMLFGKKPKKLVGANISVKTIPSHKIDGDFHDFIQYDSKHFDVLIGDVMGKGSAAALLGAATKLEFVREAGLEQSSKGQMSLATPEEIVNKAHKNTCQDLMALNGFVAICYARFNLDVGRLDFVDCGHTSIVVYNAEQKKCDVLEGGNMPLGFSPEEVYQQYSASLKPGDIVIFYSDGVIQALDQTGRPFGIERLCHHIEHSAHLTPQDMADSIFEAVKTYTNKPSHCDDLTCIIVKIEQPSQQAAVFTKSYEFEANLVELVGLRNFIRAGLTAANSKLSEEFISHMELAANETASNLVVELNKNIPDARIKTSLELFEDQCVLDFIHPGTLPAASGFTSAALDGSDTDGYGLYLLRQCVDKVEYLSLEDGLNRTRLIKYIN